MLLERGAGMAPGPIAEFAESGVTMVAVVVVVATRVGWEGGTAEAMVVVGVVTAGGRGVEAVGRAGRVEDGEMAGAVEVVAGG